jgi:hypothetical protein
MEHLFTELFLSSCYFLNLEQSSPWMQKHDAINMVVLMQSESEGNALLILIYTCSNFTT